MDYIDKLTESEKEWMSKFIEEELNTQFKNDGTDLNKTREERKKIYDRNNRQNRDLYGTLKHKSNKLVDSSNKAADIEARLSKEINPAAVENTYIDFLNYKEVEEMLLEYDIAMGKFIEETSDTQEQSLQEIQQEQDPS